MLLTEVSKYIKCNCIYYPKNKKINFNYIFSNSKNINKKSIYVIFKNHKKNHKYIKEAINKGAVAILTNQYIEKIKVTQIIVSNINLSLHILLNKLKSTAPLNTIAVTGTNGKTTVVWYISQICFYNKIPAKTYGTLGYYINTSKKNNSNLTTPEFDLLYQKAFLKKKNPYNFIFEASSHALHQERIKTFPVNIAALTNISHDHLDYHNNFKNYRDTKFKLFINHLKKNGYAILNDKIKNLNLLKKKIGINKKIITFGTKNSDVNLSKSKQKIEIKFFKKKYFLNLKDLSSIDLENISCAIACCSCLNISIEKILKVLNKMTIPPGRMQQIKIKNKKYSIFIDYAHTPDALKQILISKTINNKKPNVVFGCGGERDKNKRSKMGAIANKYADKVYVTDDNPRNENPLKIRKEILLSCPKGVEFDDRKQAIRRAIFDFHKNDILIIAGKGHEKKQVIKKKIKLFDDFQITKNELNKKLSKCMK